MCGICGEIRFDHVMPDRARIQRMMDRLARRGPDNEGCYINANVGLGHRRLAIIDLSDKASQPMVDKQHGLSLVFNGTIYNYPELRQTLAVDFNPHLRNDDLLFDLQVLHALGR